MKYEDWEQVSVYLCIWYFRSFTTLHAVCHEPVLNVNIKLWCEYLLEEDNTNIFTTNKGPHIF